MFRHIHRKRSPTAKTSSHLSEMDLTVSQQFQFLQECSIHKIPIVISSSVLYISIGTAVAQWLKFCATNRKAAGSIPDGVIGIFHWYNPSDRTMALGST